MQRGQYLVEVLAVGIGDEDLPELRVAHHLDDLRHPLGVELVENIVQEEQRRRAFSLGEDAARHMGVAVRPVKLTVLVCVAALIGVCVSVGGSIGFVGLIVPHAARLFTGANHRRVLPLSLFMGAVFLMLADLLARTVVSPIELPIGVVTSLVGAVAFVVIFFRRRRPC